MSDAYNVLFLCTGNSARSIIAESILSTEGKGLFKAHSAGSQPKGAVHPMALKVLDAMGYPNKGFSSKSWDVFATPDAPQMDFIFTVCDDAAGESCRCLAGSSNDRPLGYRGSCNIQKGGKSTRKRPSRPPRAILRTASWRFLIYRWNQLTTCPCTRVCTESARSMDQRLPRDRPPDHVRFRALSYSVGWPLHLCRHRTWPSDARRFSNYRVGRDCQGRRPNSHPNLADDHPYAVAGRFRSLERSGALLARYQRQALH